MHENRPTYILHRAGVVAPLVSAVAASICCIGPLAAALLGMTSLGALVRFERYRPLFAGVTLLLLAGAFYVTYRPRPQAACEPGSLCATHGPDRIARLNRSVLWVVTAIALLVLTFPTWASWIWG